MKKCAVDTAGLLLQFSAFQIVENQKNFSFNHMKYQIMAFIYYVNNDLFYFKANFIFAIKSSLIN